MKKVYEKGYIYLGGAITLLNRPDHSQFAAHDMDPADTRKMFEDLGWKTIVGFQTRTRFTVRMNIFKRTHSRRWMAC
ncbi:ATP-sulfurylase [Lentibacillus halodurans]|uniref:ATP-sulfurylase n=1 Tax=Lentibacillus halodurans TaxID=237679 RepID=A0A1I0XYK0_9BACI|nr:ATP-sulfurylase [Lentibacillus halodurans]